ncbi:hypothetical protein PMZ80_003307 [Knufia obscura]|uniref:Uncharacterized protein n=1 Tax=Knufia obscura TaxID=1635080 RepID=A0ABR0RTV1_9EURO|nr:hypothetical protein PMZ80_003307 [Knufia obscura]
MALPDIFLNTSWSVQYIPGVRKRMHTLHSLVEASEEQAVAARQLKALSEDCCRYLQTLGRLEPRDELNDESEKTGQLRECVITQVWPQSTSASTVSQRHCLGLSIEVRYQKTTYQVILMARRSFDENECPLTAILYKASQSTVKHIKNWLDFKFGLPSAWPLQLPSEMLPRMCSSYITLLTESWTAATDYTDAWRQATLKQAIGKLKLTIAFSSATGTEIAPKLKTLDLDLPSESTNLLLERASQRSHARGAVQDTFLDELARAIHEKTGLRLPLTGAPSLGGNQVNKNATGTREAGQDSQNSTPPAEPPLKVTKITCAAFAISVDGKLKLASKPIENADVVGYQEDVVRQAYWQLIDIVREEAERRGKEHDDQRSS